MESTVRGIPSDNVAVKPKIQIPFKKGPDHLVELAMSQDNKIFFFSVFLNHIEIFTVSGDTKDTSSKVKILARSDEMGSELQKSDQRVPDLDSQKTIITEMMKTTLVKGDTWYLVDTGWFKQWKIYVGYDSWDTSSVGDETANPGKINNKPLFKESEPNVSREHLLEEHDYMLLPEKAWQSLVEWYGIMYKQEPIARKVIEHGRYAKHLKVEVYFMDLNLCIQSDIDNVITCQFSRVEKLVNIEKKMRQLFNVPERKQVRLLNKYMSNTYEHLSKLDNTVQDEGLYQGKVIVIEPQNEDGTWPRQSKR